MSTMPNKTRYCVVKTCKNNSRTCPTKIFISTKTSWYSIIGRKELSKNSCFFICEDHFNLKEDASNWAAYSTFSRFLRLKKDVVPHLFLDAPPTVPRTYSQLGSRMRDARQRMPNFISCKPDYKQVNVGQGETEFRNYCDAPMETDPLSIDGELVQNDPILLTIENIKTEPLDDQQFEHQQIDHLGCCEDIINATEDTEESREICDTTYNLLNLSYETEQGADDIEILNDEVTEDTKPNVQELNAKLAADAQELNAKLAEGSKGRSTREENVDIFLKYLGTKLRRIDEERLHDKVESEILSVVQKYINRVRIKKDCANRARKKVSCLDKEKLRIIRNDHNYGSVLWLKD